MSENTNVKTSADLQATKLSDKHTAGTQTHTISCKSAHHAEYEYFHDFEGPQSRRTPVTPSVSSTSESVGKRGSLHTARIARAWTYHEFGSIVWCWDDVVAVVFRYYCAFGCIIHQ